MAVHDPDAHEFLPRGTDTDSVTGPQFATTIDLVIVQEGSPSTVILQPYAFLFKVNGAMLA